MKKLKKTFEKYRKWAEKTHSDPLNFTGHVIWYAITAYGLWINSLDAIALGFVVSCLFCLPSLFGYDTSKLIRIWIKSYFNTFGFVVHVIAYGLAISGLWYHDLFYIFAALILMLAANAHAGIKK